MRRMKKKAVSPLIATVLLIAFAVALGAVVMNWGRGYVQETTSKATENSAADLACNSDVEIGIIDIDGNRQVCYNSTEGRLEFLIENRKNKELEALQCRIMVSDSRIPQNVFAYNVSSAGAPDEKTGLLPNGADFLVCNVSTTGRPTQVQLIPVVKVSGTEVPCSAASLDVVNIKDCQDIY